MTGAIQTLADYSQLSHLRITQPVIDFVLSFLAILFVILTMFARVWSLDHHFNAAILCTSLVACI